MSGSARLAAVREALGEGSERIDALIVTKAVNIRWLTGFSGSSALIVIGADHAVLLTDSRYAEQAPEELRAAGSPVKVTIVAGSSIDHLGDVIPEGASVALESHDISWDTVRQIEQILPGRRLHPRQGLIETLRQIKDSDERRHLEAAAAIADAALVAIAPMLIDAADGRYREIDIAAALEHAMRERGSERVSFPTIVASGPNSARPHHHPTDRPLGDGDLVVIDFGATVNGYGSDMTRTVLIGARPTPPQQALYDAVMEAQQAGVAAVRAGVAQIEVDRACRGSLERRGFGEYFGHGTGHGLGLEIHEQPILSPRSEGILSAGLIVTIEPGAYITGLGGVRIEDTVVVTDGGCDIITHCPKTLDPAALFEPQP